LSSVNNPTSNSVYLAFKNEMDGITKIEIFNQLGQLIFSEVKNNLLYHSVISINTSSLTSGVYFVNVTNKELMSSKKLIITH
jgi:hypothetical protein